MIKSQVSAKVIQVRLRRAGNPAKARILGSFFKTGPGQYGAGDVFLGLNVPEIRAAMREYAEISLPEIEKLLHSRFHEARLLALLLWVRKFTAKGVSAAVQHKIFRNYFKNIRFINNWDLVDLSAPQIVGGFLYGKKPDLLFKMARSRHLWTRRVAILATFYFIRQNRFAETLKISELLLKDEEDLIHKATGWMLREVSKRDFGLAEEFINRHGTRMPRTMLRYAIERFPEKLRKHYLKRPREFS
ncbi:MAG TPA: DNA alkylation repair protein [Bdellovibrionales bacterium]|nr:MAG: DNA alkylation repair protein [Bdellovibrionales bacterium GWB1_52_6]OFZ06349.1 MAG: DNA alkylation repair protein [Bdellovibrionales bacterium GWA1_52_35]OFZ36573.1 MAG: DNA alkylation repair protein [Bdellovibrionales bacterium GWC1_52_8]HAR42035.1 DNA alkylation repair protein [Bdellovibrionales bacterium]HCM40102.1 DNA alkylation repair protein [Bdellovibrionales bacterium]